MKTLQRVILKNAKTELADAVKAIDKVHSLAELDKAHLRFLSKYDVYSLNCRDYNKEILGVDEFLKKMQDVLNDAWDSARDKYNKRLKYYIQLN